MRTFLAILKDSFREALDSKVFYVLLAFSVLFSISCLGIGFRRVPYEEALAKVFDARRWGAGQNEMALAMETEEDGQPRKINVLRPELVSVEPDGEAFRLVLKVEDVEAFRARMLLKMDPDNLTQGATYDEKDFETLEGADGFRQYLFFRLILAGYFPTDVKALDEDRIALTVKPAGEDVAAGAQRMTLFFGLWELNLGAASARDIVFRVQLVLANTIGGWIGVLIAIVVTSWFIPNMLRKGSVDLLLARPVPRWSILVSRYFGGLIFVGLNALFLVGGTWLGFAAGSGFANPGYLLSIVTITLLFGIMYSVSVFVGVLLRSTVLCIVFPIGFWFFCMLVTVGKRLADDPQVNSSWPVPPVLKGIATALYYVFPATSDISQLNGYFLTLGQENVGQVVALRAAWERIDFTGSILSSLAFTAVVVALAAYLFHKKDY